MTPKPAALARVCDRSLTGFIFHFYWQKHSFDSLIWLSRKRLILSLINKIVYTQCGSWRIHQLGTHDRLWLTVRLGNKISLLSRFGGWVLDIRIVLNSYFSITLKKKDWSFYWYFLWECSWSKNSTKSVKHISNNFIQDFCLSKAAIMIRKESLATALLIDIDFIITGLAYVQHSASENRLQRAVFAAYAHRWQKAALRGTEIGVNFTLLFFFSKRNKHNNTVRKTRHEAFLNR